MVFAQKWQISGLLPAFGSIENQTDSDFFLLPHLAHFVARLVVRLYFCFVGSWIVGLVIGRAESRGADISVGFFG